MIYNFSKLPHIYNNYPYQVNKSKFADKKVIVLLENSKNMSNQDCIFCKIASGEIPSDIIYETDNIIAFMDNNPLSEGHCLFIPKDHAPTLQETDNESLSELLIAIKEVANALGVEDYNVLQNNGKIAHQAIMHTHFHLIPKPSEDKGLTIGWKPLQNVDQKMIANQIKSNL